MTTPGQIYIRPGRDHHECHTVRMGDRFVDRKDSTRKGVVMSVHEGRARVRWTRSGGRRMQDMSMMTLAGDRFGRLLEVTSGDLVQRIGETSRESVRRVRSTAGHVALERIVPAGAGYTSISIESQQEWSEAATSERWCDMTDDRWRVVDEVPPPSEVQEETEPGALAMDVAANVERLVRSDGRSLNEIAEACWGDGTVKGKAAAINTMHKALGSRGYRRIDGLVHWPTERVVRGLMRGLGLDSMAALFEGRPSSPRPVDP